MILLILGIAALTGLSYLLWFLWTNREDYFGTENRHKYFAEYFKDFPVYHNSLTRPMKKKLFEPLQSMESSIPEIRKKKGIRLLEIGAGSGANFEFYPPNTNLVVVDPNPFFRQYLEKGLQKCPNVELENWVVSGAENMKGVPDDSVDVVVSTLVLCSVQDLHQVYKEIERVLVPGGKYLFMEHVLDDRTGITKLLQELAGSLGIFQFLFDGCRPDKDIETDIRKGGFASVETKRFRLDFTKGPVPLYAVYLIKPHLMGVATAPDS